MTDVSIISSYNSFHMRPFGESMRTLVLSSFKDIGVNATYEYYDPEKEYTFEDKVIIFLMPPERYIKIRGSIKKNNSKFVLWNVEPFHTDDGYCAKKYTVRMDKMVQLADGYCDIDKLWLYNKNQCDLLNTKICHYLPIGYHESLEPSRAAKKVKKTDKRGFVFLGHLTSSRREFFNVLRVKMRAAKIRRVKPKVVLSTMFSSTTGTADALRIFRVGLDVEANKFCKDAVRWHRLVCYVASDLIIVSNVKLDPYGFEDGKHYMYFKKSMDCANILDGIFKDLKKADAISKNMKKKFILDYHMTKLLREAMRELT